MSLSTGQSDKQKRSDLAQQVGDLTSTSHYVDASMRCNELLAMFNGNLSLPGVIIKVHGLHNEQLVSRHRILNVFTLPYRNEVYAKQSVSNLMGVLFPTSRALRYDTPIHQTTEWILARGTDSLQDPILVDYEGRQPSRIVETHTVLVALLTLQAQQFADLERARDSLVHAEKLASLGGLVAGVAHEINTPVGVSLSAASFLSERLMAFTARVDNKQVRKSDLDTLIQQTRETTNLILHNMGRAGALIQSFKRVSADQTSEIRREFDLAQTLNEVVQSVSPSFKHRAIQVKLDAPPALSMDSYPGAIAQIVTNLLQNAVLHAFDNRQEGVIHIVARAADLSDVTLDIQDNGCGMDPSAVKMAFEPFFTTKRNAGGTGLGLHIVHNLVSNVLGGTIELTSQKEMGSQFVMQFPRNAPTHASDGRPYSTPVATSQAFN